MKLGKLPQLPRLSKLNKPSFTFVKPAQLDRSNLGTWPIYYKVALWLGIVIILYLLFNQLFFSANKDEQAANTRQISQLENQYKTLYKYSVNLKQFQTRSDELLTELDKALEVLPSQAETPELIDNVHAAAENNSINLMTFRPGNQITHEQYYDILPVQLTANTQYRNFAQFAENVANLERLMNVSDFTFTVNDKSADLLTVASTLQTYIYNQDISALKAGKLPSDKSGRK